MEPSAENFTWLIRILAANGIGNVIPVRAACWSERKPLYLHFSEHSGNESVVESGISNGTGVWVSGITVDGLVQGLGLDRIDWIKADVEGAEPEVLKGDQWVLQRFRPKLLIEVHPVHAGFRGFILARHRLGY